MSQVAAKRIDGDIDLVKTWGDILERYTAASLTKRSDLLPALSGVAKHLQALTGARYMAGIWRDHKNSVVHLAWRCEPRATRPVEYRAPSWSWASTDNPVSFNPMGIPGGQYSCISLDRTWPHQAKMIDMQVRLATSDTTGAVSDGCISIEGLIYEIRVRPKMKPTLDGKELNMRLFLDESLDTEKTMYCLPLFKCRAYHQDTDFGIDEDIYTYLMLTRSSRRLTSYVRCGLGRMYVELDNLDQVSYKKRQRISVI